VADAACPICSAVMEAPFLVRRDVPVHQNMVYVSGEAARAADRGVLALAACARCGFVSNTAFDPDLVRYGPGYDNCQLWSPQFEVHVEDRVTRLIERGVAGKLVVEVGCGQGDFLRRLCRQSGAEGVGFDPAYVGPTDAPDAPVRFVAEPFGGMHAELGAEVVVSRHVIEHLPDPMELLTSVAAGLAGTPDAIVAFETPTIEWILDGSVVQDLFYEHCSYFSATSLQTAFERSGFVVDGVTTVFGGQYLWVEAHPGTAAPRDHTDAGRSIAGRAAAYGRAEQQLVASLRARIEELRADGPLAIWGAGAKGTTFVNLVDSEAEVIACAVDVSQTKQGAFLAGTGHPIVAPGALGGLGVRSVLVMNPNYIPEITADLAGLDIAVLDDRGELAG
jgi:2-polyprenyl-3-methyl-5-hydroxy-6-metoxy-1,4-benzoquinol methylase